MRHLSIETRSEVAALGPVLLALYLCSCDSTVQVEDGAGGGGGEPAGAPGDVDCGEATCTDGDVCCGSVSGASVECSARELCACDTCLSRTCDGPEDCSGGEACCVEELGSGVAAYCSTPDLPCIRRPR